MRRRERIILISILLSACLYVLQLVPIEWRYLAIGVFGAVTYLASALALKDDLQLYEWLTILPFPAMYSLAVGTFYFLLPENLISQIVILSIFGFGMYAIFLAGNIFSVSKGKTIQLLNAAKTISTLFGILTSLLMVNTIFSLRMPFWLIFIAVFVVHLPLVYTVAWSAKLDDTVFGENLSLSLISSLAIAEFALFLSFLPLETWVIALIIMCFFYLVIGVLQTFLTGKLFRKTAGEYALLAGFLVIFLMVVFPWR